MVADLMRNHIGLRKLTGLAADITRPEASFEVLKETCIEIDLLVERAIERTHRSLCCPTAGSRCPRKHHQRRRRIGFSRLGENVRPLRFRAAKYRRHELTHL